MIAESRAVKVAEFHNKLLALHVAGPLPGFRLCGWSSASSQRARFDSLIRSSRFSGGSVVDYGCGTGDLYQFLSETGLRFSYIGLDVNPGMLAIARKKHGDYFRV